ncbi:MAG: hypothetical protein AB1Z23_03540 [Eubacteriales bacterium]
MFLGWFFIAAALFTIVGVVIFNLGMNTARAQRMVKLIGVGGAKVLYTIIGIFLLVYGILIVTGTVVVS